MKKNIIALRQQSADSCKNALLDISKKQGHLTPQFVVEAAKNPKSELHDYFQWDDGEAANQYRLMQARFLIRTVKLEIVREETEKREVKLEVTRAFVSPPSIRGKKSYVTLKKAMDSAEMRKELIDRAIIELNGIKKRYSQLNELASVWEAIESV